MTPFTPGQSARNKMPLRFNFLAAAGLILLGSLPGVAKPLPAEQEWSPDRWTAPGSPAARSPKIAGREPGTSPASFWRLESWPRREPSIQVRHLGKNQRGDLVVESDHFRILYDQKPPLMEKVARLA